jgi:hypothetical protein
MLWHSPRYARQTARFRPRRPCGAAGARDRPLPCRPAVRLLAAPPSATRSSRRSGPPDRSSSPMSVRSLTAGHSANETGQRTCSQVCRTAATDRFARIRAALAKAIVDCIDQSLAGHIRLRPAGATGHRISRTGARPPRADFPGGTNAPCGCEDRSISWPCTSSSIPRGDFLPSRPAASRHRRDRLHPEIPNCSQRSPSVPGQAQETLPRRGLPW